MTEQLHSTLLLTCIQMYGRLDSFCDTCRLEEMERVWVLSVCDLSCTCVRVVPVVSV